MSEVQTINIIEHADGELRVSSLIIAGRTDTQHASVLRVIRDNLGDFEAFGLVGFEIAPRMPGQHGGGDTTYALLNEQQATLLVTFMRNSDVVRAFKVELVKQFYAMRQALAAPAVPTSFAEALALAANQARALEIAQPKADAWDDLVSASGSYAVADAAKMLCQVGIKTGRDRLFAYLHSIGWIYRRRDNWHALQSAVDAGRLNHKPQYHDHPDSGKHVIDAPQVRVTIKGLNELRILMLPAIVTPQAVTT
ncbi:Rha family transcriptional regulator [Leucobacter sp. 1207-22]|uniref:Rha family transcriptional regulator n=1 Tax=Leucobacter sp. 1207-22 TaxID=2604456 RepID=UPI00406452FE